MFKKVLIANRGEVALRVIRACKEMGIRTVAIYSDADKDSLHVGLADECYCVGGPSLKESYLNQEAILVVAKQAKVEAIHPGYGMLSENVEFAKKCEEQKIAWIGPTHQVMEKMSQKDTARALAKKVGVPITEGSDSLKDVNEAMKIAKEIGYPVMLKARAGGGGKGIRIVKTPQEMEHAFLTAKEEAEKSFSDGTLFLEKFLSQIKHIEVQILADQEGKIVVLGERDCSIQRKNQKLIEESPAPCISEQLRKKLYNAAKQITKACGYTTVGTVEFLVDSKENYYFCEMNTRLQVEHSVTEMVYGIDLVQWQIRTAAGGTIPFQEKQLKRTGHAIECRLNAEDIKTLLPSCGTVTLLHLPGGPNVRVDTALYQDYVVLPYYDSMLAKLIVCAGSREEAIRKMKSALAEFILVGVKMNTSMHLSVLEKKEFLTGSYTTEFYRREYEVSRNV